MRTPAVAALAFAVLPMLALADDHVVVQPGALKWTPAPAGLPLRTEICAPAGSPTGAGVHFSAPG